MTLEEWNKLDDAIQKIYEIGNVVKEERQQEFSELVKGLDTLLNKHKPFEVEVGKEYVAKFDMWLADNSYPSYGMQFIKKGEVAKVKMVYDVGVVLDINRDTDAISTEAQFKACFRAKENNNE